MKRLPDSRWVTVASHTCYDLGACASCFDVSHSLVRRFEWKDPIDYRPNDPDAERKPPRLAIYDPKGRIEADLIEIVCDATSTSRRAIRPWHPCVNVDV
jgi:hypothetical protein